MAGIGRFHGKHGEKVAHFAWYGEPCLYLINVTLYVNILLLFNFKQKIYSRTLLALTRVARKPWIARATEVLLYLCLMYNFL